MKKICLIFIGLTLFSSCGKDKSATSDDTSGDSNSKPVDQYSLVLEGVYEKNDSINVVYQEKGFYQYDKSIGQKVQGNPVSQRIEVIIPSGVALENIKLISSTNPDQQTLVLNTISVIKNNKVVLDGSSGKHSQYFLTDDGFSWDAVKSRYNLDHTKKYPPTFVGNEKALELLTK
ncbi:hypothetical protein [Flavobacterium sp.]|jgi:hypothetical protein|uniref:hypothetical protein n=1 Tax=Flavobacterium sp. TaxID=239 RepID=UPI00260666D7|nr:hypothetical protein [Flavobacterium sp.]